MINNQNHLATKFIIFLHIIATNSCIQKLWRLSTHGIHSIESAICTLAFSLFASMHFSHVAVRKNYFESASEIGLLSKELPIKVSARIKAAEDWQQIKHSAPLGWWQKQRERERESHFNRILSIRDAGAMGAQQQLLVPSIPAYISIGDVPNSSLWRAAQEHNQEAATAASSPKPSSSLE